MDESFRRLISRGTFLTAMAIGMGTAALDWKNIEVLASTVESKSEDPVVVIGAGLVGLPPQPIFPWTTSCNRVLNISRLIQCFNPKSISNRKSFDTFEEEVRTFMKRSSTIYGS